MKLYLRKISHVFFDKAFYPLWLMALLAIRVPASLKVIHLGPVGRGVFVATALSWLVSVSVNYIRKGSEFVGEVILVLYVLPLMLWPNAFWSWVIIGGTALWVARHAAIGWALATERRSHNEIQHRWAKAIAYAIVGIGWGDDLIDLAVDYFAAQSRFRARKACILGDLWILGIAIGVRLEVVHDKLRRPILNRRIGINRRQP